MKNLIAGKFSFLKLNKIKLAVFFLILVFFGSFIFVKLNLPGAHDLPRQMANGRDVLSGNFDVLTKNVYSYTEPGHPFANHHWFYGVIVFVLHKMVGWNGMVLFKAIFILLTFSMLFFAVKRKSNFWITALCSIPTIFILVGRSALRPELFSYFFVVLFLIALFDFEEDPKSKKIFWLIPAQIVWVNTHLFFPVGIMLVGGFLFEKILLNLSKLRENYAVKKLALVLVLLCASVFINPFGLDGAVYSLKVNTDENFPISSAEVKNIFEVLKVEPGWTNFSATFYLPTLILLFASFVTVFFVRKKKNGPLFEGNIIFYFLASCGSALLAFFVIRGLPLFGIIFFLVFSSNLYEIINFAKERFPIKYDLKKYNYELFFAVSFSLVLFSLAIFGQRSFMKFSEQGLGLSRNAESSIKFFKENKLKGPIFNDTDIGSYLIYYLYPEESVFSDNRFGDAYPASFFEKIYLAMIRDEDSWYRLKDEFGINVIFFNHYDSVWGARNFLFNRMYDPEWVWVYADNYAVILVKNTPEHKEIIEKFAITSENIAERLKHLTESEHWNDKLAGADVFNLLGRVDLSLPLYSKLVSLDPHNGKIWLVMARTELTKYDQGNSNPYVAALFLERALEEGWKTWETYSYLALAYLRTGQLERVKWAVNEELKLDPKNSDAQKWLGIIAEEEMRIKNEEQ